MTRLEKLARQIYEKTPPIEVEGDTWDTLVERDTEHDRELIESYYEAARQELLQRKGSHD